MQHTAATEFSYIIFSQYFHAKNRRVINLSLRHLLYSFITSCFLSFKICGLLACVVSVDHQIRGVLCTVCFNFSQQLPYQSKSTTKSASAQVLAMKCTHRVQLPFTLSVLHLPPLVLHDFPAKTLEVKMRSQTSSRRRRLSVSNGQLCSGACDKISRTFANRVGFI